MEATLQPVVACGLHRPRYGQRHKTEEVWGKSMEVSYHANPPLLQYNAQQHKFEEVLERSVEVFQRTNALLRSNLQTEAALQTEEAQYREVSMFRHPPPNFEVASVRAMA